MFYWWQKSMMFSVLFVCFIATWCHVAWANLKSPGQQHLVSNPGLFLPPSPKCRGYRHASHRAVLELHLHLLWTRVMITNLLGSPLVVMSPEKALGSHQKMVQQILKHIAGAHHVHPGHPWSWRTKFMMKPWQPHVSSATTPTSIGFQFPLSTFLLLFSYSDSGVSIYLPSMLSEPWWEIRLKSQYFQYSRF